MTEPRITVIPHQHGVPTHLCSIWRPNGGLPYQCALDITREVATWNAERQIWTPQIRLCYLHAIEYATGKPVMSLTYAERQADMRLLGA